MGDGTTSVIVLASEILTVSKEFLTDKMHPTVIIQAYRQALEDIVSILNEISTPVSLDDEAQLVKVVQSCVGTKFISRWGELAVKMAIEAVKTVKVRMR